MPPVGSSNHINNMEHHVGLRAKKVVAFVDDGSGNAVMPVTSNLNVLYIEDSVDGNISYLGKAVPGSTTGDASWQILKINETTGAVMTYADGNTDFDNIWDNRESISYS